MGDVPENSLSDGVGILALRGENLVKRFGELEALSSVSISIRRGEFFALLGPSGCGKTTLLRIIAGLEFPDSGTLMIGGSDASQLPAHERPVNTVFQSYALFPHMTVRQNIEFGLKMKRVSTGETKRRVDEIMEVVRITELAGRKPEQMSGGQRQRAALARALVNQPEVLLLDEPIGALDLKLRKELQLELMRLQRQMGTTFVFVTHDQEEALIMSDRIAVMNRGRIEQMDSGLDLYEKPRTPFVARFLGSCNLIEGSFNGFTAPHEGSLQTVMGMVQFESARLRKTLARGENIILAVRPEKLMLGFAGGEEWINSFHGVVEEIVYSGASTQYRVRLSGLSINVCMLNSQGGGQSLGLGQKVIVRIPPQALVVLDKD